MRQVNEDPAQQFARIVYNFSGAEIDPIPDGKIHRFEVPDGRRGNRIGWYVLHLNGVPAGAFGNWRTGATSTWRQESQQRHHPAEQARTDSLIQRAKALRERERTEAQHQVVERAKALWVNAEPAAACHPYLVAKRIPPEHLRQSRDVLMVPLRTVAGNLASLQLIYPNGEKRFLKGGRVTGCFALFGRQLPEVGQLYIAEGWATAATIADALSLPVVAAMNAGNLVPVAQAIRGARPRLGLTIAVDDDHRTPGNPGITKGAEAALRARCKMAFPPTCREPDCRCSDFNDVAGCVRAKL